VEFARAATGKERIRDLAGRQPETDAMPESSWPEKQAGRAAWHCQIDYRISCYLYTRVLYVVSLCLR
jgi:hypothetical protein